MFVSLWLTEWRNQTKNSSSVSLNQCSNIVPQYSVPLGIRNRRKQKISSSISPGVSEETICEIFQRKFAEYSCVSLEKEILKLFFVSMESISIKTPPRRWNDWKKFEMEANEPLEMGIYSMPWVYVEFHSCSIEKRYVSEPENECLRVNQKKRKKRYSQNVVFRYFPSRFEKSYPSLETITG